MTARREGGRRRPRRNALKKLQVRLLMWFLGAILLAGGASVVTTILTREDSSDGPNRVVSRHVQHQVARLWDDPAATEAYVAELRETTGLDLRLRRDPGVFGARRMRSGGGGGMVFEEGVAYFPIAKGGVVVGALALRTGRSPPELWRVVLALVVALVVLGAVARRVSVRLARPLEQVAFAATRFGAGDLSSRTGIDRFSKRWVAEEVRDVGRAFDGMAERIERVVTDQRELLAAISHELRSPLGRARVALEIARERASQGAGEQAVRSLEDVERQLIEVDAILGDLLASARAGLADLRAVPVPLATWLAARLEDETPGRVVLAVDPDAEPVEVAIDAALFGRAVHNVLANAWAHSHPKDLPLEMRLSRERAEDHVRLTVRDRGPGFAPDILARAFEPFVTGTGPARTPSTHGIGLGLALVHRIVEAHGGTVVARNVDGAGAEIAITLPVAKTDRAR